MVVAQHGDLQQLQLHVVDALASDQLGGEHCAWGAALVDVASEHALHSRSPVLCTVAPVTFGKPLLNNVLTFDHAQLQK